MITVGNVKPTLCHTLLSLSLPKDIVYSGHDVFIEIGLLTNYFRLLFMHLTQL